MNKLETVSQMIEKECQRNSLVDLCETWEVSINDFYEFLGNGENRRAQPENKPLSLEELEIRTDPVWVPLDDGTGYWCLCQKGLITPPSCNCFKAEYRPDWTFLAHKSKQEEK